MERQRPSNGDVLGRRDKKIEKSLRKERKRERERDRERQRGNTTYMEIDN